jgi:hypothetical protein
MKAMMYTIEAVLGTLLILMGILYIYPTNHQGETSLSEIGYSCLIYLDQNGLLRHYAVNGMTADLSSSLRNCLPSAAEFSFKVCQSPDCKASVPSDRNVYATSYVIAGDETYDRHLINLWTWLK